MGEIEGVKGAWGYVQGGMGAVSQAIANCATDRGAEIFTEKVLHFYKIVFTYNNRFTY